MSFKVQAPPLAQNVQDTKGAASGKAAASASELKKKEDAQKVGRDFEGILVRQMLAKSNIGGKGGYGDMASEAFASAVTAGGGLGFGKMIADQLGEAAFKKA